VKVIQKAAVVGKSFIEACEDELGEMVRVQAQATVGTVIFPGFPR
jgi:hypothetical protein